MQPIENVSTLVDLYQQTKSINKIASVTGLSHSTVSRRLRKAGVVLLGPRLTVDETEVLRLQASGLSTYAVAKQMNLAQSTVSRRLRNRGVKMRRGGKPKHPLTVVVAAYAEAKSIGGAARKLNLSTNAVHCRLRRAGYITVIKSTITASLSLAEVREVKIPVPENKVELLKWFGVDVDSFLDVYSIRKVRIDRRKLSELTDIEISHLLDVCRNQYRRLALKFHPDKQPQDIDRFTSINTAWERIEIMLNKLEERTHRRY